MKSIKNILPNHLKHRIKQGLLNSVSIVPASIKSKPSFIIAGIQKGGTTSLYNYLNSHSQILSVFQKEIHYFDFKYHKGTKWYAANFPFKWSVRKRQLVGEATPTYLYSPLAPMRIKRFKADMKIIILLRNPIERAYSDFKYGVKLGTRSASANFEDRVKTELDWLDKNIERLKKDENAGFLVTNHCHYLGPGLYDIWLSNWQDQFPAEQLLVISSSELFKHTQQTMDRVHNFLGIDSFTYGSLKAYNTNSYPEITNECYDLLNTFYRPHMQKLESMTNLKIEL